MENSQGFSFQLEKKNGSARAGKITTRHGDILTPVFMPVGTQATVKSLTPAQLIELPVQVILSNTYHLYLRPGHELINNFGGLHHFMQWPKPILTDSGGFQVFSLGNLRRIDQDGVDFKSHIDGSSHRFTPEFSIAVQEKLGADIIMAFDECPEPHDRKYNIEALTRTHHWAERCLRAKTRSDQALFAIVQGGVFPDLREESARFLSTFNFPGYAIGGLSVGESKQEMLSMLNVMGELLPEEKPRYLMGVGTPYDLIEGVRRGVDMFDCVLPTRLARHHAAQTMSGRINLARAEFAKDETPIDKNCGCYTCSHFSRAYLRHLIVAKEMLVSTLLSIHNIFTLTSLANTLRQSIFEERFDEVAAGLLAAMEK